MFGFTGFEIVYYIATRLAIGAGTAIGGAGVGALLGGPNRYYSCCNGGSWWHNSYSIKWLFLRTIRLRSLHEVYCKTLEKCTGNLCVKKFGLMLK
jgi:hypothetical protein